jgi:tetratricopeptide (TPR) repeat protein
LIFTSISSSRAKDFDELQGKPAQRGAHMADTTAATPHLVITVHGIRTYGDWQDELKKLLEAAEPGIVVRMYRYGFFSSLAFLIPPLRWLVGRQFRKFFENEIQLAPEGARIDLVAHSFGTYLAASALRHLPQRKRIHTVIFAGSVLPPSFPWYRYLQSGAVGRVVNECGWNDSVLVLCQSSALLMGMAGRIGFHGMVGETFTNRYYLGGHGLYFDRQQRFMREEWLPLVCGVGPVLAHDERPRLTTVEGIKLFVLSNMHVIKVAGAFLMLLLLVFIPFDWYRKAEYQKHAERINHIALLTNAQEIPGRDASHVRDLLKIDAEASGNENAIDNLIGNESSSDLRDSEAIDAEAAPRWWESLPGMGNSSREAYRARLYHHRANQQLVASNKEAGAGGKAKAQTYFQSALISYRRVNDDDPAHGSYALCLLDYGQLLADMGDHESAIKQFQTVRDSIFPPAGPGQASKRPTSLEVDSLILEAMSLKAMQKWTAAADCLNKAVAIAEKKPDKALVSDARNESGWLHIDRLEVDDAVKEFEAAEDACRAIMRDQVVYKIRLFHLRHGLALALRFKGKSGEAYDRYQQIVSDLQDVMSKDLTFSPKQRRDLRDRLINSMERKADVRFFARQAIAPPPADRGLPAPFSTRSSGPDADDSSTVEDDYEDAIELVGNDDLSTKARLLYKKVIARFIGELDGSGAIPVARRTSLRKVLGTIDLEFAEANRTTKSLPTGLQKDLELYRAMARACMGLRDSAISRQQQASTTTRAEPSTNSQLALAAAPAEFFAPKAVEKLRALTVKNAAGCDNLTRESVEMLLLAHEILVNPRVESDPVKRTADATRMMAVLGESTNVASHAELSPYFERFEQIASEQVATNMAGLNKRPVRLEYDTMRPIPIDSSPEVVLFSLRLGSRLELKLTTPRFEPEMMRPAGHDVSRQRQPEALSSKTR